jgi:hypothetical protein
MNLSTLYNFQASKNPNQGMKTTLVVELNLCTISSPVQMAGTLKVVHNLAWRMPN